MWEGFEQSNIPDEAQKLASRAEQSRVERTRQVRSQASEEAGSMSDHQAREQHLLAAGATKKSNLSSLSASPSPSKPQELLTTASESTRETLRGSGSKLLSSSSSKYLSIELNNNSIVQQPSGSPKMMMDSSTPASKQSPRRPAEQAAAANGSLAITSTNHTPSYTSIFTSPSYNRSISPPQEILQRQKVSQLNSTLAARRGSKLKKQDAAENLEIPKLVSLDRRALSHKRLSAFEFADSDRVVKRAAEDAGDASDNYRNDASQNDSDRDEDDDDDDDDDNVEEDEEEEDEESLSNEKQPFKSQTSLAKLKHANGSRANSKTATSTNQHSYRCQASRADRSNKKSTATRCAAEHESPKSPYTKISFNESRPPSFSTCQAAFDHYRHHEAAAAAAAHASNALAKLESWQIPVCARCNCTKCTKKLKVNDIGGIQMDPYGKNYTRTKSIHLVLKSIILVLLTLLLLMLFIGIIMATHYLPSVFDKVLNATRSFNVTIAGR